MKARDRITVGALRAVLHAIDNAGAVEVVEPTDPEERAARYLPVEGRAAEVARRDVGRDEVASIVRHEAEERRRAAAVYQELQRGDEAARLLAEAEVIERCLL